MGNNQSIAGLYVIMVISGMAIAIFVRISEHQDEVNRQSLDSARHEEVALKVDRIEKLLNLHGYYLHEAE